MKTKLILLSLILLYSCKEGLSQTKNINTNAKVTVMNPEINAKNYVAKMIEKVKHYDKEPLYYIRIGKANCLVEVLVNDRLVHYNYELSNFATPIVINEGIFASGTQKMTVRMYPIGDLMKQEYGEGQAMTNLTSLSAVDIRIITMDNKGEKKFKDEVEVITHTSPKDAKGHFIGKGKPFFEYSFDFQATVPYDIGLWRKGQDLKQFDKKLIEQKVIEFIKNVI
ncbi:MAG: hypothetical protein QM535_05150, partial [Limnohabitans sp.]|nr:hypothetical protein [Limnohabitans sp.]